MKEKIFDMLKHNETFTFINNEAKLDPFTSDY